MHTLKLLTLDTSTMLGGYSYENLVLALEDATSRLPNWRSRLALGVTGIDHPRWVPDLEFDVRNHVHRVVVSDDERELDDVISRLLAEPLPRDRPLWHATIVEGSSGGDIALALKIHHSLADGLAFAHILSSMTSQSPDPMVPLPETTRREVSISKRDLTKNALQTWLKNLARLPGLLLRTIRVGLRRTWTRVREHRHVTELFRGPRTPFNERATSRRVFARCTVRLEDIKEIKDAFGTSFNDVVLAAAAESLRRWMDAHGVDTHSPLIAGMPMSAEDGSGSTRRFGNKVSHAPISLHTETDEPVERLLAIHVAADQVKTDLERGGKDLLLRWAELNHPAALRMIWSLVPRLPRPPINLVLASVPGPKHRLHFAGCEVSDLSSVGPILDGVGLNITAWSYDDRVNFGLLACPEHVPDLRRMADGIATAVQALVRQARAHTVRKTRAAEQYEQPGGTSPAPLPSAS